MSAVIPAPFYGIEFRDSLPRAPVSKVLRRELIAGDREAQKLWKEDKREKRWNGESNLKGNEGWP